MGMESKTPKIIPTKGYFSAAAVTLCEKWWMHFTFSSVVPSFQGMSILIANGHFFGKQHSLVLLEKLFFSLTKIQ